MHFLALAVLVGRFVQSEWRGLTAPLMRGVVRCGENSLEIYCVGVLLSLVAHLLLLRISGGVAAQAAVSAAGIVLLTGLATPAPKVVLGRPQ